MDKGLVFVLSILCLPFINLAMFFWVLFTWILPHLQLPIFLAEPLITIMGCALFFLVWFPITVVALILFVVIIGKGGR